MNRSIKALSAQHKRVQAKQAALFAKAYDLSTALREEFGAAIYATGTDLMLDQTGPGEGTYGRLRRSNDASDDGENNSVKERGKPEKQKHIIPGITYGTTLVLAIAGALLSAWFELPVWQRSLVCFALGAAGYLGVTSALVDRYIVWSMSREMRAKRSASN